MDDLAPLRDYCEFGPDRVYLLLAVARAKENAEAGPTYRRIVEGQASLDRMAAELDRVAAGFDSRYRLYLTVNARNATKACFELRRRMDDWLEMRLDDNEEVRGKFRRVDREFASVLQSEACRDDRRFLFDLDGASADAAARFEERLRDVTTVPLVRETPNGYHLVAEPFDHAAFDADVACELKRDAAVFASYLGE